MMLELKSSVADQIPSIVAKTYDVAQRGHVLDADRVRVRVEAAPAPQESHSYEVTQLHRRPFCRRRKKGGVEILEFGKRQNCFGKTKCI